jgi:hypothetical protein
MYDNLIRYIKNNENLKKQNYNICLFADSTGRNSMEYFLILWNVEWRYVIKLVSVLLKWGCYMFLTQEISKKFAHFSRI